MDPTRGALDLLTVAVEVLKIHDLQQQLYQRAANSDMQSHSCHTFCPLKPKILPSVCADVAHSSECIRVAKPLKSSLEKCVTSTETLASGEGTFSRVVTS